MKYKKHTTKYYEVVLVNFKFRNRISCGVLRERHARKLVSIWNLLTAKGNDWIAVMQITDRKVARVSGKLVVSDGLKMHTISISDETAKGIREAFNMHYIRSKRVFLPLYWKAGQRIATIHPLDREWSRATRLHSNIMTRDSVSINLEKI
jgi:hypothetical protein